MTMRHIGETKRAAEVSTGPEVLVSVVSFGTKDVNGGDECVGEDYSVRILEKKGRKIKIKRKKLTTGDKESVVGDDGDDDDGGGGAEEVLGEVGSRVE